MNSTPELHTIYEKLDDTRNRLRQLEIALAKIETKIAVYSATAGVISGAIIGLIIKFV